MEGMNQGCRLSDIFAAPVLDRVLKPLDAMLRAQAKARLASGDLDDDGMGSITNLFAWVDNVCGAIPLVNLKFACTNFRALADPLLLDLNVHTSRILTSTDSTSVIPCLAEMQPSLSLEIEATIAEFSVKKDPVDNNKTLPVELT